MNVCVAAFGKLPYKLVGACPVHPLSFLHEFCLEHGYFDWRSILTHEDKDQPGPDD